MPFFVFYIPFAISILADSGEEFMECCGCEERSDELPLPEGTSRRDMASRERERRARARASEGWELPAFPYPAPYL